MSCEGSQGVSAAAQPGHGFNGRGGETVSIIYMRGSSQHSAARHVGTNHKATLVCLQLIQTKSQDCVSWLDIQPVPRVLE